MKSCLEELSVCVLFIFVAGTEGQCQNVGAHPKITSCDASDVIGTNVYVDFHKINRSCSCTVMSFFDGKLLVYITLEATLYSCNDNITVSSAADSVIFKCNVAYPNSYTFVVQANDTVVKAKVNYKAGSTSEMFFPCLIFGENSGRGGNVSVTCGNSTTAIITTTTAIATTPTTAATTTSTATTTTTATKTSALKLEIHSTTFSTDFSAESKYPGISIEETDSTPKTHDTTTAVFSFLQKSTSVSSDNVTYIIAGTAAGGLVLVPVLVMLVVIIVLRQKRRRKGDRTKKTDEASEHTNRAFDENYGLPDNPLYHSAQLMDEVGYSSVQKNQLGLPPTEATNTKENDPNYDVPTNNKPINDSDTSPMSIYAVPNKSRASAHEENEPQAMYAQVSKPSKSTTQGPMQSANQDGLVYLEVEKDATSVNENSPYTKNENKDSVSYAEIKRN